MFGFGKQKEIPTFLGDASDIPVKEKADKTLYDIQQEAAQGIESASDYIVADNENEPDIEIEKHGVGDIERAFDNLSAQEEQQRENERRGQGTTFDKHARGGNSKPIEKDLKGGERIGGDIDQLVA